MVEETPQRPKRRKYRPLDVKTWYEGFLRLLAWILVIFLSVATGGIFVLYELKYLNVHDTDFRDQSFDQRITNDVNNRYHKNFLLAQQCCNPDPAFFPDCPLFPDYPVGSGPWDWAPPFCKPVVVLECPDIRSNPCNAIRTVLYDAVGLAPISGTPYINCLRAGQVRVGAQAVAQGRPYMLVGYSSSSSTVGSLSIADPYDVNATQVQLFVDQVAASVDPDNVDYIQPSVQLGYSVSLAGIRPYMEFQQNTETSRNKKAGVPPWNVVSNLWPWPGMNKRCQNTNKYDGWKLRGTASITIPRFALSRPQDAQIPLTVANSTIMIAAWSVGPAEAPGDLVGGSTNVQVSYLSSIQAAVAMEPALGPCNGWQFSQDPLDLVLTYTAHWTGSVASLQAGTTFGPFVNRDVSLTIVDVANPQPIALPFYGGMWYIVLAFGMAFIWLVSTSLIVLIIPLVWWNVRSNRGLPPIVYRYMRKYRGW